MSNQYGKIDISSGKEVIEDVGGTGLSGVLIGNESGFTCKVTLTGAGIVRTLYPGTVDFFAIPDGVTWNGNVKIMPFADLNNTADWPGSYIYIDTFGPSERPNGFYPMALPRTGNIGNTVNTSMGSSNSVQNDNNVTGTQFIEATESGSPQSNVSIDNSGNAYIGQYVGGVFKKLWEVIRNSTPVVYLLNRFWSFSGSTMQVADSSGVLANVFGVDGNGFTFLQNHSTGDQSVIYSSTGVQIIAIDDSGHITIPNAVGFRAKDTGGTGRTILWVDTNNITQLQAASGSVIQLDDNTGATMIEINNSHIIIKNNTSLQIKDTGGTARDILYVDNNNETCLQIPAANKPILFKKSDGTTICGIDATNSTFQFNSGGTMKDIIYINSAAGETYFQGISTGKIKFKKGDGTDLFSVDSSGNARFRGTVTQSVTP